MKWFSSLAVFAMATVSTSAAPASLDDTITVYRLKVVSPYVSSLAFS